MTMKGICTAFILITINLVAFSQQQSYKINNFHQRYTFNTIGYNDYDLGTTSTMSYSNSIVVIDVENNGTGTLITYINQEKVIYYINDNNREANYGTIFFELFDKKDMVPNNQITSVEASLIISNNILKAFKIFIKGTNEAIILTNR